MPSDLKQLREMAAQDKRLEVNKAKKEQLRQRHQGKEDDNNITEEPQELKLDEAETKTKKPLHLAKLIAAQCFRWY